MRPTTATCSSPQAATPSSDCGNSSNAMTHRFSLNTCVQQPHQAAVTAVKFQPSAADDSHLLVSTGRDAKFRLWQPSTSDSVHSEGLRWACDSVGQYRGLTPECAAFSADGSVLGVTFGASLTLWDAETCQLSTSLTRDAHTLRAVEFGSQECCHLVVTASDAELCVWSVLTLTIVWAVRVKFSTLCADPLSSYMAVFTTDNAVFVFTPASCSPVYERKELCRADAHIVAAAFVPRPHKLLDTSAAWCANSQLHFIDSNQELQYLELESEPERGSSVRRPSPSVSARPFAVLMAQQTTDASERQPAVAHQQLGTTSDAAVRKLLSNPASTMPHIHLFCKSFLKALAVTRKSKESKMKEEPESEMKMEINEDSENDEILEQKSQGPNDDVSGPMDQDSISNFSKKDAKEISPKKKQKRKAIKDKKSSVKKENSFTFDDLDTDWLSVLKTS